MAPDGTVCRHMCRDSLEAVTLTAQAHVAADYILLKAMTDSVYAAPKARLWLNERCLVVGKSVARQGAFQVAQKALHQQGMPVVVRDTGGTVVPHGPNVLNLSLFRRVSTGEKSVSDSYKILCSGVTKTLSSLGVTATVGPVPGSYCDGDYNIVVAGKKLAGTAQRWRKCSDGSGDWLVLTHASISIGADPEAEDAIAVLYKHMGWPDMFERSAHVSLAECISTHIHDLTNFFYHQMQQHYQRSGYILI
ncbi:lipoate--protein ligase family protein [Kordiimonas pumila]|uniref:Biotin/lipoate A/B protein ligase family protein n=1 Tax=Kordiimonas pumila TaxID=2161677 RepID=A0ABV7D8J9_9PROT|nr:hypothetical protein [Kordiimonas pumila]